MTRPTDPAEADSVLQHCAIDCKSPHCRLPAVARLTFEFPTMMMLDCSFITGTSPCQISLLGFGAVYPIYQS